MHPEIQKNKPGKCPICGMNLVEKDSVKNSESMKSSNNYTPLVVVISMILLITITISLKDYFSGSFVLSKTISYFMIGFFLTFSGFKLMDLKGFADGYSTYDLLAKRVFSYGYIYPFIELFFGLAMILAPFSKSLLFFEFFVMSFSGLGVAIKLIKREKFQCACLGTFLKVPLTKVTLVEDFGMAILAAVLFFLTGR